jgi:hypothetical protein
MSKYRSPNKKKNEVIGYTIIRSAINVNCYKLPVEIWRQIFEEGVMLIPRVLLPFSTSFDLHEQSKYHYTNITISHVCRYFRHIALSAPVLWSTLNLDGSATELKTFLKRSAQLPLTVTCSESYFNPPYPRHFDLFVAIAPRIVNIDTPVKHERLLLLQLCRNLKHIMLRGCLGCQQPNVENVLAQFPSLETLWWTKATSRFLTPLSQKIYPLRSLRLSFKVSDKYLLSILRCCPALENISAHVTGTENTQEDQSIRLSRLLDLRVQFYGEDSWFCKLDIPVILDCYEFSYHTPCPESGFYQWDIQMKSLVLGEYFNLPLLVSWLGRDPGILKTLTLLLKLRSDQSQILKALEVDGNRMLCPQLEEIHIQYGVPFEQLPWLPTRKDYEELFHNIYSSRVDFGLPRLQFTWNGVVIIPRPTPEPAIETNGIQEPSHRLLYENEWGAFRWLTDV